MKQIWKDIKERWPLALLTLVFFIGAILINW